MLGVVEACQLEEALDSQFAAAVLHSDRPLLAVAVQATCSWGASADLVAYSYEVEGAEESSRRVILPGSDHRHRFHYFQQVRAR